MTAGLQIPFLLRLGSDFTQYVRSFPPSPEASFGLLGKLDHCFSSLLSGMDVDSGEVLPGFEDGPRAGMSLTDMVRCRSLVEQTRFLMVEVLGGVPDEDDDDRLQDSAEPERHDGGFPANLPSRAYNVEEDRLHMDAARIYEHTIIQLSERLGDPLEAVNITAD